MLMSLTIAAEGLAAHLGDAGRTGSYLLAMGALKVAKNDGGLPVMSLGARGSGLMLCKT